jgi:hypothetical protein
MKMISLPIVLAVASGAAYAEEPKTNGKMIPVTGDNYAQAEAAANFATWAKLGSDKKLFHYRELAPVGSAAPTVRMNWDTLYSCRIVKVSDDHTFEVTLPETDMYVSAQVIDENGFSPYFVVEKGVTKSLKVDTDYAWVLFRTEVVDRKSKEGLKKVHVVQDGIQISGMMEDSTYVMANYDKKSLLKLRADYTKEFLAGGAEFTFARKAGEVDQHVLDLSFAAGWGGYPPELHKSNAYSSSKNIPGDKAHSITFEDPKNKFFTSFTLYDTDSYLMAGETQIKSSTWKPNPDGTITLHFNAGEDAINNLSSGGKTFNYVVRNYGVSQAVLDGKFKPVDPKPVK